MAKPVARPERKPQASTGELEALARLEHGSATQSDVASIRLLIDSCGRYGCVCLKNSASSRSMDICPGWCDALSAYENRVARQNTVRKTSTPIKPRRLTRAEKLAFMHFDDGALSVSDMLAIELSCQARKDDGCVKESDSSGISSVPAGVPQEGKRMQAGGGNEAASNLA